MIGRTVSHYRILEEIGAGGMGVVYKAEDTRLKRTVALKFLPPDLTRDEAAKKRLLHEAQAISTLQHDNICTIHEIDETDDGRMFICMDYYEGETLKTRLARGPLSAEDAIDITVQIARGLENAHRRGIVHRDIKPANVMVTTQGVAKILDFGLAKLAGQTKLTKTGSTVGTAAYMSPEQVSGKEVDARSDIFSLGVTFYELLTGVTPFEADHEPAIHYKVMHVAPPSLRSSGVEHSAQIDPVVGKMLAKDPAERMASAREVIGALSHIGGEARASARGRTPRRARRVAILGSAVALLIVAGTLAVLHPWRKAPAPVGGPGEARTAIAVLPFENLSTDESHAYFAGGLHDEILTQLSKVAALEVISRTSVMGYADRKVPLRQIATELGVGSIVEGSVQVVGERLRVNVQLIDAATDRHVWAERYDRTLEDAFAIQSEVAQQIVAAVGATLTASEEKLIAGAPTANAEAYQFYLQAQAYLHRPVGGREDLESAERLYEHALALDPDLALAHAGLSQVHGQMQWSRYDPSAQRVAQQRREAETALRLAPDLPQAHLAMGIAYYFGERDYRHALEELDIALRGLPNDAGVWSWIGYVHRRMGNWDRVYEAYERATRLDPRSANVQWNLGANTFNFTRRYADAVRADDRALALAPDAKLVAVNRGWTFFQWKGELDSIRSVLDRLPSDAPMGVTETARQRASLLLLERQGGALLALLAKTPARVFEGQGEYTPTSLYGAWAYQLAGDAGAAHSAFQSALALLDSASADLRDDYRVHTARGLTLAGLGRREAALDEARWLAQSVVYREDAFQGKGVASDRALILAQAGAADAALDEIERLLAGPSWLTVHALKLDPRWDPIRQHPRFQALIAKYSKT